MDIIKRYKRDILHNKNTLQEKENLDLKWTFENYVLETLPTAIDVQITKPEEYTITEDTQYCRVVLEDITNNDKRAMDEKNLFVKVDENIDVGCYLYFDNSFWIIIFKEHRTTKDMKKYIIRRCNQFIKYKYKGVIYEIPIFIENLTMYSDGIADGVNVSIEDAKRQIWYGSNPITRLLDTNTRIMLTNSTVFRITHINDFEYVGEKTGSRGLIKSLILQTGILNEDDLENNLAYNGETEDVVDTSDYKILGSDDIYLSSYNIYQINGFDKVEFELKDSPYARLEIVDDNTCKVTATSNYSYIGSKITLVASAYGNVYEKKITIIS